MNKTPARARRRDAADAADLDDAPGRPLPARIPGDARQGRRFPVALLQPRSGDRGDAAADPPLSASTRRSSSPTSCWCRRRSAPICGSSQGEGPRLSTITRPRRLGAVAPGSEIHETLSPIYETVRILRRDCPPTRRADRLCRRALDRRHLHDRRPRHARPGPGARAEGRRPGRLRRADRADDRGDDRLPLAPRSMRAPKSSRSSTAGPDR